MLKRSLLTVTFLAGVLAYAAPAASTGGESPGTPTLTALRGGGLEVSGPAWSRALLLVGDWENDGQAHGRRVDPIRTAWVELDAEGHCSFPAERPGAPLFAQLWSPPVPGAASTGSWSGAIVLLPMDPADKSVVQTGDIVITEFMKDPSAVTDSHGEWIEIRNNLKWRCDIEGMILSDSSGASFVFSAGAGGIQLHPFRHFILALDDDPATNGGVNVKLRYSGFTLKNSSDEIYLHDSTGVLLDAVEYDDGVLWPDTSGMSISLSPAVTDPVLNDDPSLWCHSSSSYGDGDNGTPGAVNDVCP
jgi:hypothetical protein